MEKLTSGLLFIITIGTALAEDPPTCMNARARCSTRIGCSMALSNFQIACGSVKLGNVNHCTDVCMKSVVSLVTVKDNIGTDYLTCDCAGNDECNLWKQRISMCSDSVLNALQSLDSEDVISCSLARMLCEADTQCWTALSYYEQLCSNLWVKHSKEGLECSARCNNSLSILYKQSRATKLKNCLCDNSDPLIDEETCIRMRYNTQTYCLSTEPSRPFFIDGTKSTLKPPLASTAAGKSVSTKTILALHTLTLILTYILPNLT